jgi:ribosomal protein L22
MESKAILRYARVAPKARQVMNLVTGKDVEALNILNFFLSMHLLR